MDGSHDKPHVDHCPPDAEFLKQRLDAIGAGLKEGIRREVARLEKLGLPIWVEKDGKIVDLQTMKTPPDNAAS